MTTLNYYTDPVVGIDRDTPSIYNYYFNAPLYSNVLERVRFDISTNTTERTTVTNELPDSSGTVDFLRANRKGFLYTARVVTTALGFDVYMYRTYLKSGDTSFRKIISMSGTGTAMGEHIYINPSVKFIFIGNDDSIGLTCNYLPVSCSHYGKPSYIR
jgi:hypothetical protein